MFSTKLKLKTKKILLIDYFCKNQNDYPKYIAEKCKAVLPPDNFS